MGDVWAGPVSRGPTQGTVRQLREQLGRIRGLLTTVAAAAGELDRWADALPVRHVPGAEEVLVTDLIQTTVTDPGGQQRHVQGVEDLAGQILDAVQEVRDSVATQTGPFAAAGGFGAAEGTVQVTLSCASPDAAAFDEQRQAARRTNLADQLP